MHSFLSLFPELRYFILREGGIMIVFYGLNLNQNCMERSLNEELNSMMQSVSRNIGQYDLTPQPLFSGKNSQVFHITSRVDKKSHALKVIYKRAGLKTEQTTRLSFIRERKLHESIKNRYVLQLYNTFADENSFYLVLEYCQGGNLRNFMKNPLSNQEVRNIGLQIAKGISYLHKNKIVHADIKPENILLTKEKEVKLCDFGSAFRLEEQEKVRQCMRGDFLYSPPEAIEKANQSKDIWAFGCILYELATGKHPFCYKNWKQLVQTITDTYLKSYQFNKSLSPSLLHLLKKIFIRDWNKRPKIQQILLHSFFTNQPLQASIPTQKSEERNQSKKSRQKMKSTFRSLQLKQNKRQLNKTDKQNNKNLINLPLQTYVHPDYKKMIEKKFRQQSSKVSSKQNSDRKQTLKIKEQLQNKISRVNLNYNVRKNIYEDKKGLTSPLKTDGMIIKQIEKAKSKIMIDKNGFTRTGQTDEMNISADGKVIRFRKNNNQKIYSFQALPDKYLDKYMEAKKIVKQAMTCTPKMFYKDQQIELTIMYNNTICASFTNGPSLKGLLLENIMKKNISIAPQHCSMIQRLALGLFSLSKSKN